MDKVNSSEDGQTMVEYLLLLVVVVSILLGIFRILEERLLTNPNSFQNQFIGGFTNTLGNGGAYKTYSIPR